LLSPHRLSRRHQGAVGQGDPRGALSRARARKGRRAHVAARPARPRPTRQSAGLQGPRASARGANPHAARRRRAELQKFPERLIRAEPTLSSLADLNQAAVAAAQEAPKYVQKLDKQGRAYATGKRKNAIARVWIKPGTGKISVNGRDVAVYFARPVLRMIIQQPLGVAKRTGQYDLTVTVVGGGLSGQAGAVRHGLSKALTYYEPDLRTPLKREGFLTRHPRVVERKKYG